MTLAKSSVGAGYGAFATRAVVEGEVLFELPEQKACISLFTACGDADVGESLARLTATGQGGATVALAGFIAKEWLCSGADGPRGPYLAMLPWDAEWPPEGEQEQEHVLWWSEAQVDRLEGSPAYSDAVDIRDEVALAAKVLKSLLGPAVRKAYKARGEPVWAVWRAEEDIEKAVRGAFVSILTRSFTQEEEEEGGALEGEGGGEAGGEKRLVPLLDMLQHGASAANVRHGVQTDGEGARSVVVTASRAIEAGEELLNDYDGGELPAEKFLTRFGFVPGKSVGEFVQTIGGKSALPFGFRPY